MSVKTDDSGRRRVEVEVEVPGTPEAVWKAIAKGPGISSWFVPTEVDERVGGKAVASFGPGMDSISTITEWQPPERMAAESHDLGADGPTVGSEWIVEAKSGDTCIVRVVHSLFVDTDEWDKELEAWESGWPDFFRILKLYLEHFAGQPSRLVQLMAITPQSPTDAWSKLAGALGVDGIAEGDDRQVEVAGSPPFDLHVELAGAHGPHAAELLMRATAPTPGIAHWFAMGMGPQTCLSLRFYLFGDSAETTANEIEPAWGAWLAELFPAEGGVGSSA